MSTSGNWQWLFMSPMAIVNLFLSPELPLTGGLAIVPTKSWCLIPPPSHHALPLNVCFSVSLAFYEGQCLIPLHLLQLLVFFFLFLSLCICFPIFVSCFCLFHEIIWVCRGLRILAVGSECLGSSCSFDPQANYIHGLSIFQSPSLQIDRE